MIGLGIGIKKKEGTVEKGANEKPCSYRFSLLLTRTCVCVCVCGCLTFFFCRHPLCHPSSSSSPSMSTATVVHCRLRCCASHEISISSASSSSSFFGLNYSVSPIFSVYLFIFYSYVLVASFVSFVVWTEEPRRPSCEFISQVVGCRQ